MNKNDIFTFTLEEATFITESVYGEVIVDYCIIPEYDAMLENYSKK